MHDPALSASNEPSMLLDAQHPRVVSDDVCASLRSSNQGSIIVDFISRIDAPILQVKGENGSLDIAIDGGRINGTQRVGDDVRHLDAEDARGLDDGAWHTLAFTVRGDGTHLYVDGYEAFSTTIDKWMDAVRPTSIVLDPRSVMSIERLRITDGAISDNAIVATAHAPVPMLEFAAARLSDRDAKRCSSLAFGALRARFRTRGTGQGGTLIEAKGAAGTLAMGIDAGSLFFTATVADEKAASVYAPGHWDDGAWHDAVAVAGRGAIDLYIDGYQVAHEPGVVFFSDLGEVNAVSVGMNLAGARFFGEAQSAMIYDAVLSDFQVKRLAGVEPLETRALFDTGMNDSVSYRIPSLLRLDSGVILAGADQRVSIANDSPNDINFVMRRSLDDGRTWEDVATLIKYPGDGALGSSVIDSVLVQDSNTGRVIVVIDQFPGGIGQPNNVQGRGYTDDGLLQLFDVDGAEYHLLDDGTVVTATGESTDYRVDTQGNVTQNGSDAGNIHLAKGVDPKESLLTLRTSYLKMIYSDDDGATWSEPIDITHQVKKDWMRFLGTSPGNGIQLRHGPHAGRLVVPAYYNREEGITFSCAALYSDDGGETWTLGESPNDNRELFGATVHSRTLTDDRGSLHESVLVEDTDGTVHCYMRNQHPSGRVAHATSGDGGQSWSEIDYVDQLTEIFSQPNAIGVEVDERTHGIVFVNASQMLPFRGCGVLRLSFDNGQTWPHNRVFNPRHYVYQCMAQLGDGSIGLLWERETQGLFFTRIPLSWLMESSSTVS